MLFDVKDLYKKELVENGNQAALLEMAEYYKTRRAEISIRYYEDVIKQSCTCDPIDYLDAIIEVKADKLDRDEVEEALTLAKRAKVFMEENLPEHQWMIWVFEFVVKIEKILQLKKRVEQGEQDALYELAYLYRDEEYQFQNYPKANEYYLELTSQECKIDKLDYFRGLHYIAWYAKERCNEYKKALDLYKEAKVFMEENLPADKWELDLYRDIIETKNEIVNKGN